MYFIRLNRSCQKIKCLHPIQFCKAYTEYRIPNIEDEYTSKPEYPPILDLSRKAEDERKLESWYKKIERQCTIEEKLFEINMPRYFGWKCAMVREGIIPYNFLGYAQYITRTHVVPPNDSSNFFQNQNMQSQSLASSIKEAVEDDLNYQLSLCPKCSITSSNSEDKKIIADTVVKSLHRILMRELNHKTQHLKEVQVDFNPRLESFWSVGGLEPPESVKNRRKKEENLKDEKDINEPVNRWVQYLGNPCLQVRHKNPLPDAWPLDMKGDVPVTTFEPEVVGLENEYRHGTSIPGFWPGDCGEFSLLSYHTCNGLDDRPPTYGKDDYREALLCQGILASYSWLVSLAAYQGFSPFSEITYPFVTQTVLTDGKNFTFMVYQMNTNLVHGNYATENPKVNVCWCSETQSLYEAFEDNKIIGFNENVLERLVGMYLVEPSERIGVNLKPFLGREVQKIADFDDVEKRSWLEKYFKHFSSNRPRHRKDLIYEVYAWEKIYKIDHDTRPMDPRRRPFELEEHPFRRKMSDHTPRYIPKRDRPDIDLPRYKQRKHEKTFYPQ